MWRSLWDVFPEKQRALLRSLARSPISNSLDCSPRTSKEVFAHLNIKPARSRSIQRRQRWQSREHISPHRVAKLDCNSLHWGRTSFFLCVGSCMALQWNPIDDRGRHGHVYGCASQPDQITGGNSTPQRWSAMSTTRCVLLRTSQFHYELRSHTASSFVDRPAARRNASRTSPQRSDNLVLAARNRNIRYLQPMGYKKEKPWHESVTPSMEALNPFSMISVRNPNIDAYQSTFMEWSVKYRKGEGWWSLFPSRKRWA